MFYHTFNYFLTSLFNKRVTLKPNQKTCLSSLIWTNNYYFIFWPLCSIYLWLINFLVICLIFLLITWLFFVFLFFILKRYQWITGIFRRSNIWYIWHSSLSWFLFHYFKTRAFGYIQFYIWCWIKSITSLSLCLVKIYFAPIISALLHYF